MENCYTAVGYGGGCAAGSAAYRYARRGERAADDGGCARQEPWNGCTGGVISPADDLPVTMAYAPRQSWVNTYDSAAALCRGSLFPELDKPFTGCRGEGAK